MTFLDTDFLKNDEIMLVLDHTAEADPVKKYVPAYYFKICDRQGQPMGYCDLRIGYCDNLYYGGHIGYTIDEPFRGHHYAEKASRLLFELAKKHGMAYLYITCVPDNTPSRRTCERLGGELLEIAELPPDNNMRLEDGKTKVCVFRFVL